MERLFVGAGALAGLTGVGLSAYAAHMLTGPAAVSVNAAVEMQMIHALALLFTALWARRGGWLPRLAGIAFIVGVVLFCGGITVTYLGGPRLTAVAPAGGMTLMAGWLLLALSAVLR
jgi:uncharacterized membrane protein YgdD (TMEM256/DUF423 family)